MTKHANNLVQDIAAFTRKVVAELADPSGAARLKAALKSASEADLQLIQRLRSDKTVLDLPVTEVLRLIGQEMTSKALYSFHDFQTKQHARGEAKDTPELLRKLEESLTNYMIQMSELWDQNPPK